MTTNTATQWTPPPGLVDVLRERECERCKRGWHYGRPDPCSDCHGLGRVLGISKLVLPVEQDLDRIVQVDGMDHVEIEREYGRHERITLAEFIGNFCPFGPVGGVVEVQEQVRTFNPQSGGELQRETQAISRIRNAGVEALMLRQIDPGKVHMAHPAGWHEVYPDVKWKHDRYVWLIDVEVAP